MSTSTRDVRELYFSNLREKEKEFYPCYYVEYPRSTPSRRNGTHLVNRFSDHTFLSHDQEQ